jgi:hypothetical protein
LGVANYSTDNYDEAEGHFIESLDLSRQSNNKRFQAENLVYLGRVAVKHSDLIKLRFF